MAFTGAVIFGLTYVLVSARRLSWVPLDRPAVALTGAVAAVVTGALTPSDALAAVDTSTLLLLLGVMGMGAFLALDDVFEWLEGILLRRRPTPRRLLGSLVWLAGGLSAIVTNDAACVFLTPVVLRLVRRHELPALPYLLALATAANVGSVATLVGNPQNMLCASLGGLAFREHVVLLAPVAVFGLAIDHVLLVGVFGRRLPEGRLEAPTDVSPISRRARATLVLLGLTAALLVAGTDLAWTATGGFVAMMLVHRRETRMLWGRIDGTLLLFFAGLFVVVEALVKSGVPAEAFRHFALWAPEAGGAAWARVSAIFLVGSNVVSNVPFILVVRDQMASLPDPHLGWELLAMVSTFAGNLTLLGSVANIIVAEGAREIGGLGFVDHLKIGVPLTLLTTAVGTAWLLAWGL